jgi:hypothetical protein
LRVDPANRILGLRLNLWTSLLVGLGALVYLVVSTRLRPGRETSVVRPAVAGATNDGTTSTDDEEPRPGDAESAAVPVDKGVPGRRGSDSATTNDD